MSDLVCQIWIALALDFILGDPRWLPHPVRLIGRVAQALESPARRYISNERLAGAATAAAVISGTALAAWGILSASGRISPLAEDFLSIWLLYTSMAARDLGDHGRRVLKALDKGDLAGARVAVSYMVGRDTGSLDLSGVIRGTVESVAENTVDGVLAPLFFAVLLGPVGALAFKAASTLDSTFGYKTPRYLRFGWASARIDDMANYIPARLSLLFIAIGAWAAGKRPVRAFCIGLRDARKHASPNAGFPEACFAGALGVQLGGSLVRKGVPSEAPLLGNPGAPLEKNHISRAVALMVAATLAAAILMTGARAVLERF